MVDYGYHFIQSFNGKEVSSEGCNDIGIELAQNLWGDKYQVLVCTHVDKDNVHNHIILNSVSFVDGSKYHNSKVELALLRQTNDDLCSKYGLYIIESDKSEKENNIADSRIQNYNRNSGKMELIKQDIDEAIKKSTKYQEFVDELAYKGYYLKKSNNLLSISTPYFNRNIRLARAFGEYYTFENIKDRIYYINYKPKENKIYKIKIYEGVKINQFLLEHSSFYRIYPNEQDHVCTVASRTSQSMHESIRFVPYTYVCAAAYRRDGTQEYLIDRKKNPVNIICQYKIRIGACYL